MTINISLPEGQADLRPKITVVGVGGAGGKSRRAIGRLRKCAPLNLYTRLGGGCESRRCFDSSLQELPFSMM